MSEEKQRRGPLLFLVVFGAAFAFLVLLFAGIVIGSQMRTAASPPDQDARDAWVLVVAIGGVLGAAGIFGFLFRLALNERRDE